MPALAFGLNAPKSKAALPKAPQKRKNLFDDEENEDTGDDGQNGHKPAPEKLTSLGGFDDEDASPRPRKSPKLAHASSVKSAPLVQKYTNLSSLHSAKLQDAKANSLDASVYDYDGVYETFHVPKTASSSAEASSGPKYMQSLLKSADVRKRDQLRAKEKQLQRERENEGDDFADKEKFVTGAYKQQQEEVKRLEEEEARKEAEEEERRRKGGGMTAWHREVLKKEEERMRLIEQAAEEAAKGGGTKTNSDDAEDDDVAAAKAAAELNQKGAHIVVNDDGEVVDKRQLLSAGLNAAKKPSQGPSDGAKSTASTQRDAGYQRSSAAQMARLSQRERQTRMMEEQLAEMTEKARQAEEEEQRQREEKLKSTKTEADKMSARERFLARKKEREQEAKNPKSKAAGGDG